MTCLHIIQISAKICYLFCSQISQIERENEKVTAMMNKLSEEAEEREETLAAANDKCQKLKKQQVPYAFVIPYYSSPLLMSSPEKL